eukprot:TRINITY_DN10501_c0_g1_i1.p1 TRINITY_DN10501_c0_g1~~TRINITY_DN10501_c0_g1_i1.p1  ORF type:complete len:181 (+),score=25.12 TRINITY_DN10501_c0_g1_i1:286-828(+)
MIMPNGCLFHIDFGYILNTDPKPSVMGVPTIRVDSSWFKEAGSENKHLFGPMIYASFVVLRRHEDVLRPMMHLLGEIDPSLDRLTVDHHCAKVFLTGRHEDSAFAHFWDTINQSTDASGGLLRDWLHQCARNGVAGQGQEAVVNGIYSLGSTVAAIPEYVFSSASEADALKIYVAGYGLK